MTYFHQVNIYFMAAQSRVFQFPVVSKKTRTDTQTREMVSRNSHVLQELNPCAVLEIERK